MLSSPTRSVRPLRWLRHADHFDWDGLLTLVLTGLLLVASAGLILLPSFVLTYRTARRASSNAPIEGDCLVFGKRSHRSRIDDEYRQRLAKAAELFRQHPRTLILLGGSTTAGEPTEAQMGLRRLRDLGLPKSAPIRLEEQSRHTLENLRNARELGPHNPILISSRYHLARCSLIACNLGMTHSLCAAESKLPYEPISGMKLLKEAFFILWFRVGRGWARLTGNRRMLERIH